MEKNEDTFEETPRVVIAVPCSDSASMKVLTAHAIGSSILNSKGLVIDFLVRQSADIVSNRTWLVKEAIKKEATHILFIDSDMYFPNDTIERLLAHGVEIVGADYNRRQFPLQSVSKPLTERSATDLYEAEHIGLGVTLIDLSIFTNTEHPVGGQNEIHPRGIAWFSFGRNAEGEMVTGEDVWFCSVAQDAGYDIWIDPLLSKEVKHLGEFPF